MGADWLGEGSVGKWKIDNTMFLMLFCRCKVIQILLLQLLKQIKPKINGKFLRQTCDICMYLIKTDLTLLLY